MFMHTYVNIYPTYLVFFLLSFSVYMPAAFDEQIMMSDDVQFQHWTFYANVVGTSGT